MVRTLRVILRERSNRMVPLGKWECEGRRTEESVIA